MRFGTAPIVVIVICTLVCSAGIATAECSSIDRQQISAVRDAWVTNWNAQHIGEVVNLYAPDASYLSADGNRLSGQNDIRSYFDKLSGSTISVQSVTLDCSGDIAADSGSYIQDFAGGGATINNGATISSGATIAGGGKDKHIQGQYLVVLKRLSGGGGMGGKAGMGGNAGMGGGGSRWVIEQHASTMKP